MMKKKIGIALSGGGTRGIAHLGVIKALSEAGIIADKITGVSSGAILGAFVCAGNSPEEVLEVISKTKLFNFLRPAFKSTGLLKLEQAGKLIQKHINCTTFEQMKIALAVSALNLRTGQITYFEKGDIIQPILASSSIPMLFNPIEINGDQYVDGGLAENLSVNPLQKTCEFVIGVHSNPINANHPKFTIRTLLERIFLLAINSNAKYSIKELSFLIEPEQLKDIRWSDYSKAKEIYTIGYEYTLKIIPALQKELMASEEIL